MNASEFFAMGGYGLYVWGSYGIALVILVANIWLARRRHQQVERELRNLAQLRGSEHP